MQRCSALIVPEAREMTQCWNLINSEALAKLGGDAQNRHARNQIVSMT